MTFGRLSPEQVRTLTPYVVGQNVVDAGAGDLTRSRALLRYGAASVVAIDKEPPERGSRDPRLRFVRAYFVDFHEPIDTLFLSWPQNYTLPGLLDMIDRARCVIYLGKNTDMTACGWPGLFKHLLQRPLLAYVPTRTNVLTVYDRGTVVRQATGEEYAAIHSGSYRAWTYEEAEDAVRTWQPPDLMPDV